MVLIGYGLLVVLTVLIAAATRGPRRSEGDWRWFWTWAATSGLVAFSVVSAFSIGLFVLPLTLVPLWYAVRSARLWPEVLGVPAGVAGLCLLIAALNANYRPCPADGSVTLGAGQTSASCGGFDPMPWLATGVVLAVLGIGGYIGLRRGDQVGSPGPA